MHRNKLPKNTYTNNIVLPHIGLILTTAIWAIAGPVIKITLGYVPPFTFLLIRFTVVCLIMLPIMYFQMAKTPIDKRDIKNLILLGLAGQASLAFLFLGFDFTTVIDVAIIGTLAPLLAIFAGHHFFNEKVNKTTKIGVCLAMMGTLIVALEPIIEQLISPNNTGLGIQRLIGNAFVIVYTLASTFYFVYSKVVMGNKSKKMKGFLNLLHIKPMVKSYSPLLSTGFTFYIALIAIVPFALLEAKGVFGTYSVNLFSNGILNTVPIIGILYMSVLSSIVAYVMYEWAINKIDVSDGAIYGYLNPVFVLPIAYIFLGEVLSTENIIGIILISIGVFIAEIYKRKS